MTRSVIMPRALLLDFGGVIVETSDRSGWMTELSTELHARITSRVGRVLSLGDIEIDVVAAARAAASWRNAMSRPLRPKEMSAREYWGDFVAADWPASARRFVEDNATYLSKRQGVLTQDRFMRDGVRQLFGQAERASIPVGIVSNAISGQVHREWMTAQGLDHRVAVEIYSDEAGVRKPNPELILLAARNLGISPEDTWYVGDTYDRDVVCGHRAGVAATILMESRATQHGAYRVNNEPDARVADPTELCRLLSDSCVNCDDDL